ncbi:MAG TPA: CotH kinase family protein [Bacteroidales bacterium]|nr:CotH kinase family protein [Bacteroidales bacterium]
MMKKFPAVLCIFFPTLWFTNTLTAQPEFPPNAPVFDSSTVARIDITIDPDTLAWIYENVDSDIEFHATFRFENQTIDELVENVGFRLRGNTSRYSQKKSFKVSFNTFEPGKKFQGMEKLNLNGEHNDPSIIRSRICWEWLRTAGVPAPRAAHATVYINGDYYGLYIMVEHVDEEFAESRFGNKNGNLYKCLWPADLDYLGNDPDLYKFYQNGRQAYELKINEEYNNYSDLAHFIDVLNNTPPEDLECELEKVFNLNDYLKIMALDVITGNWDGYIYNKNNFYLYHNTETGRFEYIPYDLDNTLGIDWMDRDWATRDIYDWEQHGTEVRPLYARLLEVPGIKDRYSFFFKKFLDLLSEEDSLITAIGGIRTMIAPFVMNDPFYPLDYGYTYDNFINSYDQALGGHVDYGLIPYIQTRRTTALQQLVINGIPPVINYIESSKAVPGEEYWIRATVTDESADFTVKLKYSINGGTELLVNMKDDGTHHDHEEDDGCYGYEFDGFDIGQILSWQVMVTDPESMITVRPCSPVIIDIHTSDDPQIFINELMADNDTTITDEFGEYDNWVEIYNADDHPVWMGDKYLSDNLSNPDKWKLPDVSIPPGGFLLIWTDGQPGQGPFHTDYKLNDEGESLAIFDNESTGYFLIDSISWGLIPIDVSYGREEDGFLSWIYFNHATPGYSNGSFGTDEPEPVVKSTRFYPNPVKNGTIYFDDIFNGCILNATGMIVMRIEGEKITNVGHLRSGLYFLLDSETGRSFKVFIIH